ncbi:hypothetical protein HDU85_000885 [Gaertneriomyces sp. JEL0708]|nr:hypothetical protein HDU85_000885 [Gaertneriomyces sp. JEL0708]
MLSKNVPSRRRSLIIAMAIALSCGLMFVYLDTSKVETGLSTLTQLHCSQFAGMKLVKPIPPLKSRDDIAALLEKEGATVGIELGVQLGLFSESTLKKWPSCEQYILVDVWAHQENYVDGANVSNEKQEAKYRETLKRLSPWKNITRVMRMYTNDAHPILADQGVQADYVYVDARHDYCGTLDDIKNYWPLLRPGGIMAGHDFITNEDVKVYLPKEDWGICADGSRNDGAVKGAVMDFADAMGLQVVATYKDTQWVTWMIRKPLYM